MPNYRSKTEKEEDLAADARIRLVLNGNIVRCSTNQELTELVAAGREAAEELREAAYRTESDAMAYDLAETRLRKALAPFADVEV